jgi:transposase
MPEESRGFAFPFHEEPVMKTVTPTAAPTLIGVGIDTARYGHRVTFLRDDRQPATKPLTITENQEGYRQLGEKLLELHRRHPQAELRVHIDAAGQYAANLERFLQEFGVPLAISVGEPKRNKDYHKALFPKRTNDDTESQAMARFALAEQPPPAVRVPEAHQWLREIASRLQGAVKDTTRASNRLHNLLARTFPELAAQVSSVRAAWVEALLARYPTPQQLAVAAPSDLENIPHLKPEMAQKLQAAAKTTVGSLKGDVAEALIGHQVQQLQACQASVKTLEKLLAQAFQALPRSGHVQVETIPGIGVTTAAVLVAKMITIDRFATPENLVGYFGVFPEENTSGVDRFGNKRPPGTMQMSTKGSDLVRRYLWNAAKSAIQCNPAVRALYARLRARGTRGDVALGHCMRKLLHQVFGVWKSDRAYCEAAAMPRPANCQEASTPADPSLAEAASDGSPPAEITTAAGHTREACPQSTVVTAATCNVARRAEPVKPCGSRGSVDYAYLREQIGMEQVLRHLGYLDRLRGGTQRVGPCPFHTAKRTGSRSFSVNLKKHVFRCCDPTCQVHGNVLDLWALAHRLPLYEAALDLADTFHLHTQRTQRRGNP